MKIGDEKKERDDMREEDNDEPQLASQYTEDVKKKIDGRKDGQKEKK